MEGLQELIESYYPYDFDDNQLYLIAMGVSNGLDVSRFALECYDYCQMEQIYLGLLHEVDTSIYENPQLSGSRMKIIRIALEDCTFSDDMLLLCLSEKELVEISRYNKSAISVKKDYYKLRKERKNEEENQKQLIDELKLDEIDFDSILDEDDEEYLYFDELSISESVYINDDENDWETMDDYDYYFNHFYDLKFDNPYAEVIKNNPVFSSQEEIMFFKKYNDSYEGSFTNASIWFDHYQLRNKIYLSNIALAISLARKYKCNIDIEDLYMAAFEGLDNAIDKFDYAKGFRFSTYAFWWIRQSISRYIQNNNSLIKLPIHLQEKINKINKCEDKLRMLRGRDVTPNELSKYMKKKYGAKKAYNVECIKEVRMFSQPPISFEYYKSEISNIPEDESLSPVTYHFEQELHRELDYLLKTALTEREQEILKLRFGLDDGKTRTLEEAGAIFDCTRERIRQIEAKALRKLKNPNKLKRLIDFIQNRK
jgi:RNA polymerase primary sigma factor